MNKTTSLQQQLCLHTYIFLQICVSFHCIILNMDLIPLLTDTDVCKLIEKPNVLIYGYKLQEILCSEISMHMKDMKMIKLY